MRVVLYILKEKNSRTIGAKINDNGNILNLSTADLLKYKQRGIIFDNAIITGEGYVRGRGCALPVRTLGVDLLAPLYHGSIGGIKGDISLSYGDDAMDFGRSFYTGTYKMQAVERVAKYSDSYLYTYELNTDGLNMYSFKDDVLWALYVAKNRGAINDLYDCKHLIEFFKTHIDCCDVIYGYIADDKMSNAYRDFINGALTDKGLVESLKLVKYGKQYALRTNKAIKSLVQVNTVKLSLDTKNKAIKWGNAEKVNMMSRLKEIKIRNRKRGNVLYDVLRRYERYAKNNRL